MIVFVGSDLTKNVFAGHSANDAGKAQLVRPWGRSAIGCWRC
jgi:hypothetical protein